MTEDLEQCVMNAVTSLPRTHKISLKKRQTMEEKKEKKKDCADEQTLTKHCLDGIPMQVVRTFLYFDVQSSLRSEPPLERNTVSTTNAGKGKGNNPRSKVKRSERIASIRRSA